MVFLYDLITRDPTLKKTGGPPHWVYMIDQLDEKDFLDPAK